MSTYCDRTKTTMGNVKAASFNLGEDIYKALGAQACSVLFFFQAEDGIRDHCVTGVQTCALPISSMGTNVIIILPGATTVGGVRGGQGGAVTLTVADGLELKKRVPLLSETAWAKRDVMQIVYGNRNWNGPVNGISPGYLTVRDWNYTSGGAFTQVDLDTAARVALVGQTVVENLYDPGEEPVGSTIRLKNVPFRVIGVLAPNGQSAQGSDQDDVISIPFTTAERKVLGTLFLGSVGALFASTDRLDDLPQAVEGIRETLRARHRLQPEQPDDFTIRTQVDIGSVQEGTSQTLTMMMFAIASISLVVGGIGIMNILLVSVTERTREIGVRMAVGAKRRHILAQFLIEAMTLRSEEHTSELQSHSDLVCRLLLEKKKKKVE